MVNGGRRRTLGLAPLSPLMSELECDGKPVTKLYCCSPRVVPVPADWDESTKVTGYWFLDGARGWRPPDELSAFLKGGPSPVYVGFGSARPIRRAPAPQHSRP